MKKRITLMAAIMFGFANCIFAQQLFKSASIEQNSKNENQKEVKKRALENDLPQIILGTNWDINTNDWSTSWDTTEITYFTNGLKSEEKEKYSWGYQYINNYKYDGAGREIYSFSLYYDINNQTLDTNRISFKEYDENGLIKKSVDYYKYNGDVIDSSVSTYENKVDGNGNIIEQISSEWDTDLRRMVKTQKILFSYGSNDEFNRLELQIWNDLTQDFMTQIVYDTVIWHTFVKNDASLELSKPAYVSGGGSIEGDELKLRIKFEYDEHDNEITQTHYMSMDGGENWMEDLGDVYEYTYDNEGRCIESRNKYYDEDSAAYIWSNRKLYSNFYAAPNLDVKNLDKNYVVYPNPANGLINIQGEVTSVAIYSIQGQVVKTIFGKSKNPSIDISDLYQGYYWVNWTLSDGSSVTQKLQVQ